MSVIEAIEVEISVVLGSARVPIRHLLRMGRGAVIPLDSGDSDPALIFVNDELVASGEILVDGDKLSISISDVAKRTS